MELKELFFLAKNKNILEQHKLPYTFFTEPVKMLTEETCLDQIVRLLSNDIPFPHNDSSDLFDMIEGKSEFPELYKNLNLNLNETSELNVKTPYIKPTHDPFVNLICFMKAYASHTYTHKGSFKEYFKDVFDVFYNINSRYL